MPDQPTPDLLRAFAAELILEAHVDYDYMGIGEQMLNHPSFKDLGQDEFDKTQQAVAELMATASVATAWAGHEVESAELTFLLDGYYLGDERETANGVCFPGFVDAMATDLPARLLAWRDAAVNAALLAAKDGV